MSNATEIDIRSLEGWLYKKKSKDSFTSFLADANLRWFKIYNVNKASGNPSEMALALCYFHNQKSKNANGYIFLKDIVEISDDGKEFTVISANRSFTLLSETPVEHYFWLKALVKLCPTASTSRLTSKIGETFIERGGGKNSNNSTSLRPVSSSLSAVITPATLSSNNKIFQQSSVEGKYAVNDNQCIQNQKHSPSPQKPAWPQRLITKSSASKKAIINNDDVYDNHSNAWIDATDLDLNANDSDDDSHINYNNNENSYSSSGNKKHQQQRQSQLHASNNNNSNLKSSSRDDDNSNNRQRNSATKQQQQDCIKDTDAYGTNVNAPGGSSSTNHQKWRKDSQASGSDDSYSSHRSRDSNNSGGGNNKRDDHRNTSQHSSGHYSTTGDLSHRLNGHISPEKNKSRDKDRGDEGGAIRKDGIAHQQRHQSDANVDEDELKVDKSRSSHHTSTPRKTATSSAMINNSRSNNSHYTSPRLSPREPVGPSPITTASTVSASAGTKSFFGDVNGGGSDYNNNSINNSNSNMNKYKNNNNNNNSSGIGRHSGAKHVDDDDDDDGSSIDDNVNDDGYVRGNCNNNTNSRSSTTDRPSFRSPKVMMMPPPPMSSAPAAMRAFSTNSNNNTPRGNINQNIDNNMEDTDSSSS